MPIRLDTCPDCATDNRSHTGTYCQNCGSPLVVPKPPQAVGEDELGSILRKPVEASEHRRDAPCPRYLPGLSPWL